MRALAQPIFSHNFHHFIPHATYASLRAFAADQNNVNLRFFTAASRPANQYVQRAAADVAYR